MASHHINKRNMINDITLTISLVLSLLIVESVQLLINNNHPAIFFVLMFFFIKLFYNCIMHVYRRKLNLDVA